MDCSIIRRLNMFAHQIANFTSGTPAYFVATRSRPIAVYDSNALLFAAHAVHRGSHDIHGFSFQLKSSMSHWAAANIFHFNIDRRLGCLFGCATHIWANS